MAEHLDLVSFEQRFRELLRDAEAEDHGHGSIQCVNCVGCSSCTFCRDSEYLVRCHYCVASSRCIDCSHCRGSRHLIQCNHCIECENCSSSAYLVRCVGMLDSTYCFGCVGLSRKDFHILNEPYDRSRYFEITRRLMRELKYG